VLAIDGRCDRHRRAEQREIDARRGTRTSRGYDNRWARARAGFLRAHPLCVQCEADGRVTAATVVDHIRPHKGNQALFWDQSNWQSLCASCHSRKTAATDGRWGGRDESA
jgi:5-methylcytosine-specific restriction protein A